MSEIRIPANRLDKAVFAGFGDVICADSPDPTIINMGLCDRHNDLADLDHDASGRLGVSVFDSRLVTLPHRIDIMERHPMGPQCFFPLDGESFLVTVAHDSDGVPTCPVAFITSPRTGICYRRNTWHGPLTPLVGSGLFAVIDWIGPGSNLEECRLTEAITVTGP